MYSLFNKKIGADQSVKFDKYKFENSGMKKSTILMLLFCSCFFHALSQDVFHFRKGLFAPVPTRYGREALYTDLLAYQLYTNTLQTPAANAVWGRDSNGEEIAWQPIEADSANRLFARNARGSFGFGRSGYIYLTYTSDREKVALLNVRGAGSFYFNGELHAADTYNSGWLYLPVKIKKGINQLYLRGGFAMASLSFPGSPVMINTEDPTLPGIVVGAQQHDLQGAVVIINTTGKDLDGLQIRSELLGNTVSSIIPSIPAMSVRKVKFRIDAGAVKDTGKKECNLSLLRKNIILHNASVTLEAVTPSDKYSITFTSGIDSSLQYYAVTPQSAGDNTNSALFLSVHGAGVEALGQARAYQSKDWGNLVAPTNRRPRGFNWEDWGRIDALEVLQLARQRFNPDPRKIYLTGHSMGGHGTWFLGATYPDKWAAIAPCAGYPTLKGYGSADGLVPDSSTNPNEQMLLLASNQSDVIKLVSNYKPLGVYVFHGDDDRTVSVDYARQMRKLLGQFHTDFNYYEYPGGSHWFGNESVDWDPIFDFFKWHRRPVDTTVHTIDFMTASPGISASYYWAAVSQQQQPLQYSRIKLSRNSTTGTISGTTENVRLLQFDLQYFGADKQVKIILDSLPTIQYTTKSAADTIYLVKEDAGWHITAKPGLHEKGPHRYGTFKDAFNHNMVFVYSTAGTAAENKWAKDKARYDAETWYYRGNGSVDIIADKDYSLSAYKDRGVVLYGNRATNKAWNILLNECPISVDRNRVTVGDRYWQGNDLAAYFVWPVPGSHRASVAVVSGSGIAGMHAANANQYFAGASGFPDYMIFGLDMLKNGSNEVKMAGYFDHKWTLQTP